MNIVVICCRDVDHVVKMSQGEYGSEWNGNGHNASVIGIGVKTNSDGKQDSTDVKKKRSFKEPQCDFVIDNYSHKEFAPQSKRKIKWAVGMYNEWREQRLMEKNVHNAIKLCDLDHLGTFTKRDLAYSLVRFVREIKKIDGSDYPPNTLREILIMIQMYLHQNDVFWKILDHAEFVTLCNVLDNTMCERTVMGLGVKVSSDIISLENESKLFECGELGDDNPQKLLNTVIYMVGLHFALWGGGTEHTRLRR